MSKAMSLSKIITAEAQRLGFELAGITTPEPPLHLEVYKAWLAAGRHGEMGYLASDRAVRRRADPHILLPGCKSILVLGIRYPHPGEYVQSIEPGSSNVGETRLRGHISSYAWGVDYHDVLPERLRSLVAFIESQVGHEVPNRCYTDTGPVLERELAQRAGLGWIGKNTCLINPDQGSYFFLAEILLGIELEPAPPFDHDRCGTCTRCLEACPTGCILPDRTIDACRCISYLTIELKGAIPMELRSQMGDWIFGCDVCQQVCPWNRFGETNGDPAFAPRAGVPYPNLLAEMDLGPEEFNRMFKGSPLKRAKRRGYLRNVAVALGNTGDASALPVLERAASSDTEELVREHAVWALERIRGREGR
jgi:epoxyqueuosine reductase